MRYRVVLLGTVVVMGVAGCYLATGGQAFHLPAMRVRAVDAVAQRPIPGAILAGEWRTSALVCIEGECPRTLVRTAEAVTDAAGFAELPAATVRRPGWETLRATQPRLMMYKAGYAVVPPQHGVALLLPPTSAAEARVRGEVMRRMLGPSLWQWPPDKFPRLTAEANKDAP